MFKLLLSFSFASLLFSSSWGQATSFELTDSVIGKGAIYQMPELRYGTCPPRDGVDEPINIEYVDSLADFLKSQKELNIQIRVHTDSRGSAEMNLKYSQRNADHLKIQLTQRGVNEDRIQSLGLGEGEPRTVRVVDGKHFFHETPSWNTDKKIILTEEYINKFRKTDKQLYEQLHQWNRRTEVVVVDIID